MNRPEVDEIHGCGDGGCIFGHPGGMHTNGGCSCLRYLQPLSERHRIHRNVVALRGHIADLKRQHVDELAKMAGDQLARDADMYNLAEEAKRLREHLTEGTIRVGHLVSTLRHIARNASVMTAHQIETMARDALEKQA